jgi:acylaminoacyl-peptidase
VGKKRAKGPRTVSALNAGLQGELSLVEPLDRRWRTDAGEVQGWLLPGGEGRQPLVVEIHGGPHTLYGWSPMLEWQVLAGAGVSVLATNPRGSEGYGEEFNRANLGDWGDGPMADVIAGVDQAVDDGLADPDRLGVTGGSYGGYLTTWIVGRTQRFKAAITCRSVADMAMLFLTGDISGGEWAKVEFGRIPWDDPVYYHSISPISLAKEIRTPLLIQHSERDLRTTVAQAEALFTVLRSLKRPVRFMRVPDESHELTRSGTPFRRAENLVQVRDWFVHFLVRGERRLPAPPRNRAGR